jgi:hypothetical protein
VDKKPSILQDLAGDLLGQLDNVTWAQKKFGKPLDRWQKNVMNSAYNRILLNIHRQAGKSTTAGLLALNMAETEPGSLTILLSPTQRQSGELLHTVQIINDGAGVAQESATRIEFENGSRILSLPGSEKTTRGYAGVDLLIIDEASRVDDELYYSVRPMLAVSGGKLVGMSTPFGKRGWFYEEWSKGVGWQREKVTAWECPRISKEFLEEERATLGPLWFAQEYECQFIDAMSSVFNLEAIEQVFAEEVERWTL